MEGDRARGAPDRALFHQSELRHAPDPSTKQIEMLNWIASAVLVTGGTTGTDEDLARYAKALAEAQSGTFTVLTETERGGDAAEGRGGDTEGGGRGGEGAGRGRGVGRGGFGGGFGGDAEPVTTKGQWSQGHPMQLRIGETVAYKDGDQVVMKDADGEWALVERNMRRGGVGGGERGGGGGGVGERGQRGGEGSGDRSDRAAQMQRMRATMEIVRVSNPTAAFSDLASKVTNVTKAEKEGGAVVFEGDLTEAAAQELGGGGMAGRGGADGERGGGRGPEMDVTGKFRIEVQKGAISKVRFEIVRSGSFGEREFEMTTTRSMTFEKLGETEYEVPAGALAHFEI